MDGLFRRGGFWWARLVVPARLRQAAGRREFVRYTGTQDKTMGKLVSAVLTSVHDVICASHTKGRLVEFLM